jgi:hypothetical protein
MDYKFTEIYGKGSTLTPISKTNARRIKLDIPSGYDKFNFYSINTGGGYFDIIEGKSGSAVSVGNKGLSAAKNKAVENINKIAKSPEGLTQIIDSAIRRNISRLKNEKKKIPTDYLSRAKEQKIVRISPAKKETKYSVKLDKMRTAKAPGKRKAGPNAEKPYYYENRRNRTDKPGTKL